MIASPRLLLSQLQDAKNGLEDAQIALCGAVTARAEARRILERAEAYLLCEGIEGKNEKERAARLQLELTAGYTGLHDAEDALTQAQCTYECAKLEWDLARYSVRVLEGSLATAA